MPTSLPTLIVLAALTLFQAAAVADDDERWRGSESKQQFRDGPCKVEEGTKSGEAKRKTECKDGGDAARNGEWKREFRDGACKMKQEAKHDGFKEEVECKSGSSATATLRSTCPHTLVCSESRSRAGRLRPAAWCPVHESD